MINALAVIALSCCIMSAVSANQAPIDVGTQRQLFVDDYIIESMQNAFRVWHQPVKYPGNPILEFKPPQAAGRGSIIYDEEEHLFKMWYERRPHAVAYATSADGINWEFPNLGLIEFHDSKNNNIVFYRECRGNITPCVIKDPVAKDPQRRYKMIYNNMPNGVGIAFSPNGIDWTPVPDKKVAESSNSPNSVLWDPQLGKYVAHTRGAVRLGSGRDWNYGCRAVLQSESDDFLNWTTYGIIMSPDENDPPWSRQFYNMEWMPYANMYFGFLAVYHILPNMEPLLKITPGIPWLDKVDIQLAFSRDDRTWTRPRYRQAFIPNGSSPEDFDWGMLHVIQHPIVKYDEIWIYYLGSPRLHHTGRKEVRGSALGLAKLRLDGFASIDAGGEAPGYGGSPGIVVTKPLQMSGDRLIINANTKLGVAVGAIQVEILGADGQPVRGFSKQDADLMAGDSVFLFVTWKGNADVSSLKGKPIALKFYMNGSRLYSFRFAD